MSNHARGLWGYSGRSADGTELTVQATGMGGPSAAMVLADLAKLGVRRAVRIGTCVGLDPEAAPGAILLVTEALAEGGSATSFGLAPGEAVSPDAALLDRLAEELEGAARRARMASFDTMPAGGQSAPGVAAADMQTVAVLARGRQLGIAVAAVLVVTEVAASESRLSDEELQEAVKPAGRAASAVLSGST